MYELNWAGKSESLKQLSKTERLRLSPSIIGDRGSRFHTFIEGDNLETLKLLLPEYEEQVSVIYIDPPYNTGNAFVYDDDFRSQGQPLTTIEGETQRNLYDSSKRHTRWLNMMFPRLHLARRFLRNDGVIFISIDDNEYANLRIIMNEVFGVDNFIQTFLWLHGKGKKDKYSRTQHQYVLCFAKNKKALVPWTVEVLKSYDRVANPDEDPRGAWFSGSVSFSETRSNSNHSNYFSIRSPTGKEWTRQWLCTKSQMTEYLKQDAIYFGPEPKQNNVPRLKIFPHLDTIIPPNIIQDVGTTRSASRHLRGYFDGHKLFDYPKPVGLIKHLIQMAKPEGGVVLDFFAGSGTTGEAVMQLHEQSQIQYRAILVQQAEGINPNRYPDRVLWCKANKLEPTISAVCRHRLLQLKSSSMGFRFFHTVLDS